MIGVVLFIVGTIVFASSIGGRFVAWDDSQLITDNPLLRPDADLWAVWKAPYNGLYAPLTYSAYVFIAGFARTRDAGFDPTPFHVANVLLHCAGGVLLWLWLRQLAGRNGPATVGTVVGAVFWVIHPIQVEPVSWASGLNSVLSGTLAIGALLLAGLGITATRRSRWAWLAASCLLAVLSLCAKPSALMLPVMLVAVHRLVLRRRWKETIILAGVWGLLMLPFGLIGRSTQALGMMETPPPPGERVLVATHAIGHYLTHVAWPVKFGIDYGLTPQRVLAGRLWVIPTIVALGMTAVAILLRKRTPWVLAGWIMFVAGVAPVLGFIPFYFQSYSTVADRYAYLSLAGVALGVCFVVREAATVLEFKGHPHRGIVIASGLVLVTLVVLTLNQIPTWHDTSALMHRAVAVNPDSIAGNGNLGIQAHQAGDLRSAETYLVRALKNRSYDSALRADYAGVLLETGRPEQASREFLRVVNEQPGNARAFNGLGLALVALGNDKDALSAFARAVHSDSSLADAHANAGWVFLRRNDSKTAAAAFHQALSIDPRQRRALAGLQQLDAAGPPH